MHRPTRGNAHQIHKIQLAQLSQPAAPCCLSKVSTAASQLPTTAAPRLPTSYQLSFSGIPTTCHHGPFTHTLLVNSTLNHQTCKSNSLFTALSLLSTALRHLVEDGDISNTVESITLVIIQIAFLLVMMAKEMMLDFSLMNWTVFSLYSVV